ncbi:MAG: serine/threonine-protein kinase [Myxococcota bacterium]
MGTICATCAEATDDDDDACRGCGADPRLDGRYRLVRAIGRGAAGTTWEAVRLADGARVAIKETVLRREDADKAHQLAEREARVLRQLAHPAIPAFVEHLRTGTGRTRSLWLVQQYVDGVDLARGLADHRYTEAEVLAVLDGLCGVLGYLHGLSPPVLHRDLKPSNVIRTADGALVLVDFGSVRDALASELGGSTVAGTFGFMAPEQFAGDASPRSDLYGLGALAVALLTREDPAKLHTPDGRIAWRTRAVVGAGTAALLDDLLAPNPLLRPASVTAVRERLRRTSARPRPQLAAARPPASALIPPELRPFAQVADLPDPFDPDPFPDPIVPYRPSTPPARITLESAAVAFGIPLAVAVALAVLALVWVLLGALS